MPSFSPPTVRQGSSDPFWGRYSIPVGQSVVKVDGVYTTMPYPWLGTIAELTEGVDYFLGGHDYPVTNAVAEALVADGYTVDGEIIPTDPNAFGSGGFGEGAFGT